MKKSVLLLITLIFLLSVVLIGSLGAQALIDDPIIYVTNIEFTNEGIEKDYSNNEWISYIKLQYTEGLKYRLKWKCYPNDVDNDDVIFLYDTSSEVASVNEIGEVTFYKAGAIKITVKAIDGSNTTKQITLIALK